MENKNVSDFKNFDVVITDNDNNFYGIVRIEHCRLKLDIVNLLIEDIIIRLCKNDKNIFYEKFSEIIGDMSEMLGNEITEIQNERCCVILCYNNCDIVNVDNFRIGKYWEDVKGKKNTDEKKITYNKKDLDYIVDTICCMLGNNQNVDSIGEHFVDWCENGNVFEENIDSKIYLMNLVKEKVDDLTDLLLKLYNNI